MTKTSIERRQLREMCDLKDLDGQVIASVECTLDVEVTVLIERHSGGTDRIKLPQQKILRVKIDRDLPAGDYVLVRSHGEQGCPCRLTGRILQPTGW